MTDNKQYPPFPGKPTTSLFSTSVRFVSEEELRDYVDADRAMRAAQAAPASQMVKEAVSVGGGVTRLDLTDAGRRALTSNAAEIPSAPASQDAEGAVLSAVKLQAQIWEQEARTQAAIVRDCYQLATDATGEPGDWNGSNPVREKIVALTEARDALMAALERAYSWMDSQADAQSKGCHATFDLMMLREERDAAKAAIDAARSKQEAK